MQALTALLKQMETRLREVESDLQKIKKQTALLLEENNALRSALAHVCGQEEETEDKNKVADRSGGAFENLQRLYEQGFHICNVHFGHLRKEECLFCISLLERGRAAHADEK